jgi:hypothetical protein
MQHKDYLKDIDCYTESIKLNNEEPATYSNRALAYIK